MTEAAQEDAAREHRWGVPVLLFALTLLSTTWVGAEMHGLDLVETFSTEGPLRALLAFLRGWDFSVPLMSILLAHELGHYIAGRIHRVDISPPYFIPMPVLSMLGTMGAVIRMQGRIPRRDALLDVGASGPLAGFFVTIPILVFGILQSPIEAIPTSGNFILEGHSLLYVGMLYALKGPIPEGMDIMLTPTAFAAWAGLLVTMINLVPVGQLDGGHIAYALIGPSQDRYGRIVRFSLPVIALVTASALAFPVWRSGATWMQTLEAASGGIHWLVWFGMLSLLARLSGDGHPPTDDDVLSRGRRIVAIATLALFIVLFMPWWVRAA
jgi:membrane-associated protease RseP (regulator of RpoE activity)